MNGGSFHMTYPKIMSSASKKRATNCLKLQGEIPKLKKEKLEDIPETEILNFDELGVDLNCFRNFNQDEIDTSIYIGGYILKKTYFRHDCGAGECYNCFKSYIAIDEEKSTIKENAYFKDIDRGKLTVPSNLLAEIICISIKFFTKYIQYKAHKTRFFRDQTIKLLKELILDNLEKEIEIDLCEKHAEKFYTILDTILRKISNILIKNLVNKLSDYEELDVIAKGAVNAQRKISRFDTNDLQLEKFDNGQP